MTPEIAQGKHTPEWTWNHFKDCEGVLDGYRISTPDFGSVMRDPIAIIPEGPHALERAELIASAPSFAAEVEKLKEQRRQILIREEDAYNKRDSLAAENEQLRKDKAAWLAVCEEYNERIQRLRNEDVLMRRDYKLVMEQRDQLLEAIKRYRQKKRISHYDAICHKCGEVVGWDTPDDGNALCNDCWAAAAIASVEKEKSK